MNSGRLGSDAYRMRFDISLPHSLETTSSSGVSPDFGDASPLPLPENLRHRADIGSSSTSDIREQLKTAIERTTGYLIDRQHPEGYWVGQLEGDTILESETILLYVFLNRGNDPLVKELAEAIRKRQLATGGWAIYPGGPLEISASVKAYWGMKIAGFDIESEEMIRTREAILAAGGAEKVNSFTRYYMALLGVLSYHQCPAVPPEMVLLPSWMPFNLHEMSAWSRTILVPLSLLWAHRPARTLPEEQHIRELFQTSPEAVSPVMEPSETLDPLSRKTWFNWTKIFRGVDLTIKALERLHLMPLRRLAIRRSLRWVLDRFPESDGLGAIYPPIIWSIIALKCCGYDDDAPEVQEAFKALSLLLHKGSEMTVFQPCLSPVWDTAISVLALREAQVPARHPAVSKAIDWLLAKEIRTPGDWTIRQKDLEPAGWCFEFRNQFYPDVDDTAMVVLALARSLPERADGVNWRTDPLLYPWSLDPRDRHVEGVVSGKANTVADALTDLDQMQPTLQAIRRGARWIIGMQSADGGWGAFDKDNTRELLTRVPFADHNAMIDPSSADLAGRVLEMCAELDFPADDESLERAIRFIWEHQETDRCWFGRWGVNYIYGTWQVLVGLTAIGCDTDDRRIRGAAEWLKAKQQSCGGWGETPRTYDEPELRGTGPVTPSQTAWALMGLMAAGEVDSPVVERGIHYLLSTQKEDGTWDEPWFTGTGFPRVFYLKYHMYAIYFPLMAIARYVRLKRKV
ncbi:MAG: terpene cyclase/mutase family protein [Planctomycetota bacterium]|nr:terpene cyclase/mutase family protein [Planctomycetota bacterium]MDA1213580.1 terpene cyclase/mutase family protein [Planctomycetota bacterium]